MEKSDGSLPTYEESISSSSGFGSAPKIPTGQRIIDHISVSRAQNISLVAGQYVIPEVERRAREGLSDTVIVLLPSDIVRPVQDDSPYAFEDNTPKPELVGFPSDDEVINVYLEGNMNRAGFWKQPGVVEDFQRLLKERLSTSEELQRTIPKPSAIPGGAISAPAKPQRRGLFSRFSSSSQSQNEQQQNRLPERSIDMAEALKVDVRIDEICVRTTTEFGLFETINRQAIIVKINARC